MAFDSQWVGNALSLVPRFTRTYPLITSDSRQVVPGCLFIALPGEKFDGHTFIHQAVQMGAEGVIAVAGKVPADLPANIEVFLVKDTLEAYRTLAHAWRKRLTVPIVLVAGSVGKTTTKEILSAILRGRFRNVASTAGSQNGFIGIPMTLLSVPATTDIAVIEVGIDEPGTMAGHVALVEPTHALLTAIGPEHLEKLIDLETVAREEGLALQIPAKNGATVVVRLDDPWISKIFDTLPTDAKNWTCLLRAGTEPVKSLLDKTVRGDYSSSKESLTVLLADGSGFELSLPVPGAHNGGNLLVAVTTALALGLSPIEIQRGLATFQGAQGRSELKILPGPTPILCDYYNANPTSVAAGLELLATTALKHQSRRKIAVLGDMLELGPKEEAFHRSIAEKIGLAGISTLFLYGERMKWLADEMKKTLSGIRTHHSNSHDEISEALLNEMRPGDALMIKGSRGMKMEEVWKRIEPRLLAAATVTGGA